MTYQKLGYGASPRVGAGFDEMVFVVTGIVYAERVVSGGIINAGQKEGHAIFTAGAGGGALRLQTTTVAWNGMPQTPVVRFTGACHRPYVESVTEGRGVLVRVDLAAGQTLEIDMARHTVRRDGEMVWGYSGRWFSVKPGDALRAGAEGIGAGFSAEVDLRDQSQITRATAGVGVLSLFASGESA